MCRRFNVLCLIWFTCSFWISIINPLNTETDHQSFSALENELNLNDSLSWNTSRSKIKNRRQRSIWQLYEVITCITPCNPFVLKDYGCYCGLGGTGRPVDPIDKCCMLHDYCYHRTPCHQTLTYFLPYDWVCVSGRPVCSIPLRWSAANACSVQLCECDRMFSECLNTVGCPKYKAVCKTDHFRHMWQKILIQFWNRMFK